MPQNEKGVLELCPFPDFPFYTCVSHVHHSLIASISADRQRIILGISVVWLPCDDSIAG